MLQEHADIKILYLILDLLILNFAVAFVFYLNPLITSEYIDFSQKRLYFLHANISEMVAYLLYSKRNYFLTDKFFERLKLRSKRFLILVFTMFVFAEIILPKDYQRLLIIEYLALFYLLKIAIFFFVYKTQKKRYRKENFGNRVVILGPANTIKALGCLLENNPRLGFKVVGYISKFKDCDKNIYLGCISELPQLADTHKINMIFVTDPKYFSSKKITKLLSLCNKTGLRMRYILMDKYWDKITLGETNTQSFFEIYNPQIIPLDYLSYRIQKRTFDFLFSLFVIVFIFSWLLPIIALLIKLESRGPVFFIQERTGINNKTFKCYKFRSMTVNKASDTQQAQKNDSRITKIGSFLRKSNIDELPQFFNVLLGQMSVVGPRPHMLKHTEQYSALIEHYKVRHFVKPGITGWAQVNGFRGITDELWKMEKRVEYDMTYLDKWSFIWDIKIIMMTVLGKNAYKNAM